MRSLFEGAGILPRRPAIGRGKVEEAPGGVLALAKAQSCEIGAEAGWETGEWLGLPRLCKPCHGSFIPKALGGTGGF